MTKKSIRPEDILPAGVDGVEIAGGMVRKGTIAAFLANADIFADLSADEEQKHAALATMQELAPAVIAIGLHKHVQFKNPQIEQILIDAKQKR